MHLHIIDPSELNPGVDLYPNTGVQTLCGRVVDYAQTTERSAGMRAFTICAGCLMVDLAKPSMEISL